MKIPVSDHTVYKTKAVSYFVMRRLFFFNYYGFCVSFGFLSISDCGI